MDLIQLAGAHALQTCERGGIVLITRTRTAEELDKR
jgi:hypothetical protein